MDALSPGQQEALLDLYKMEIEKRLHFLDDEKAEPLLKLLPEGILEQLREGDQEVFGERLFCELKISPLKSELFHSLLTYFANTDDSLHSVLSYVERRSQFNTVLGHYEQFMDYLDSEKCHEYLKSIEQYASVVSSIENSFKEIEAEDGRKRILLRTVSPLGCNAAYDILHTIYGSSEKATQFVEALCPGFERFYQHVCQDRKDPRGLVRVWPVESDLSIFHDPIRVEQATTTVDLNYDDFTDKGGRRLLLSTIDHKMYKERPINLRNYQKELCEDAKSSRNCIVCAPTGSGKTIVAAYIIKNHLETAWDSKRRVLFTVYNTAILDQQKEQLEKFIGHRFEVDASCGEDSRSLRELLSAKDVIVCTPQMIVNLLKNNSLGQDLDSTNQPFSLEAFSLIVFDECHNTKGGSPYSEMMKNYHRNMSCRAYKTPPQIVGLTASLGVGQNAKDHRAALKHIVDLCALLDCQTISLVRKNIDELHRFSPPTADELRLCDEDGDDSRRPFTTLLKEFMKKMEERMGQLFREDHVQYKRMVLEQIEDEERHIVHFKNITFPPPGDKLSMEYLQWISQHLKTIIPEETGIGESLRTKVTELFQILLALYRTLELSSDFTTKDAYEFMGRELARGSWSPAIRQLYNEYKDKLEGHTSDRCSLITAVEELILEQQQQASNFRAIVFVKTRKGTRILSNLLNGREKLQKQEIRSEAISGVNASAESNTNREQSDILDRFRSAATRVLVSTSVAEEGLDIAQCSLVIKYNYSTNEIAHVQRRGRGRAIGSRCILVTNQANIKKQEESNILKERLMKLAIAEIENHRVNLPSKVEKAIKCLRDEIQRADEEQELHVAGQIASGIVYDIICKKCEAKFCTHDQIKQRGSHYLICNPDFWSKCTTRAIPEEKQQKYTGFAILECNGTSCGIELGRVVRMNDYDLPILAADCFVLRFTAPGGEEQKKVANKWQKVKQNYFTPAEIRQYDMAAMSEAAPNFGGTIKFNIDH